MFPHFCPLHCKNRWKTRLPPIPTLQLWLAHRCLHWFSGVFCLLSISRACTEVWCRSDVSPCICWCLCDESARSSAKCRSSNCNHKVHWIRFLFWFGTALMIQSIDKQKGWQQASLPHPCLNLEPLNQLPLMDHSARQTLIIVLRLTNFKAAWWPSWFLPCWECRNQLAGLHVWCICWKWSVKKLLKVFCSST